MKRKLQKAQLKYALLFPARLKIIHYKKSHFFESPADAEEWLEVMGLGSTQDSQMVPPSQGPKARRQPSYRRSQQTTKGPSSMGPSQSQQQQAKETALLIAESFREDSNKIFTESEEDTAHSDSEQSITLFPSITPQTAELLIDS